MLVLRRVGLVGSTLPHLKSINDNITHSLPLSFFLSFSLFHFKKLIKLIVLSVILYCNAFFHPPIFVVLCHFLSLSLSSTCYLPFRYSPLHVLTPPKNSLTRASSHPYNSPPFCGATNKRKREKQY